MQINPWQTLYVCSLEAANQALAMQADSLCAPFATDQGEFAINTNLDHWRLMEGGSGKLVRLVIELQHGWFRVDGAMRLLRGCCIELELSLKLQALEAKPGQSALVLDLRQANDDPEQSAPGFVTPVGFKSGEGDKSWSLLEQRLVSGLIAEHLVGQSALIDLILAEVDTTTTEKAAWLVQPYVDYSYVELADGRGFICLLGATSEPEGSGGGFDPMLFKRHSPIYSVVTKSLFVQHVLMPCLPAAFGANATPAHFLFDPKTQTISSAKAIATAKVKGYQPYINSLQVSVKGGEVQFVCKGSCDMNFLGVTMAFSIDSTYKLAYVAATGSLSFVLVKSTSENSHHIPVLTRVAFILGLGAVGLAMAIVMEFVVPAVTTGIVSKLANAPGLKNFGSSMAEPVRWLSDTSLIHQSVYLDDVLVVESDLAEAVRA